MALIWDKSREEEEEVCHFQQTLEMHKTKLWLEKGFSDNVVAIVVAVAAEGLYLTFKKAGGGGGGSGWRKLHFKGAF